MSGSSRNILYLRTKAVVWGGAASRRYLSSLTQACSPSSSRRSQGGFVTTVGGGDAVDGSGDADDDDGVISDGKLCLADAPAAALTAPRALMSPVVKVVSPATPAFAAPVCARYIASALTSFPRNIGQGRPWHSPARKMTKKHSIAS